MDLDGMHRDVRGLKAALARMESVIAFVEGMKAAGFDPGKNAPGAVVDLSDDQKAQVRQQFSEIIGPVSKDIDLKLNSFDDRLKSMEAGRGGVGDTADFSQRLTAIEDAMKAGKDSDLRDRVEQMVTWFESNKEGLELLLGFDGEVDDPGTVNGGTAGGQGGASTLAGGPIAGSEGLAGAGSTGTGTEGPTPGSGGPVGEAGGAPLQADPATQADQANKEPVAGRDQV